MPALAAVPKPGSPGADATGADAAPEPAHADEVAWDAQGAQPDQDALALTGMHTPWHTPSAVYCIQYPLA
jgi:hypothetical protein